MLKDGEVRYLNNSGTRWILKGAKARLIVARDKYDKIRRVKYFEQFGNFAVLAFDYRGRVVKGLPDPFRDVVGNVVVRIEP